MYGFGVIVLLFSAFVSVQSFINNKQAKEQIATLGENISKDEQGVSEGTGDEPSEDEISESAIYAFQVTNPQDPRYIRIPELGILARVKNLGTTPEGAVDAPKNIYDAGWYNGSARPGNSVGSSLILAHVSGWTSAGLFKNINKLVDGSEFEVEKGNGEIIKYSVTKKEQIPVDQVNMSKVLSTETAGQHDIKLMTCSGKYNKSTKTFDDRYIVYAKQI
jgi:LPXTG-site transpeptidase (sortase) family protein